FGGGLGRERRGLQARLPRLRARAEHGIADRLGAARPDGGGSGRPSGGQARHRLSLTHAGRRRLLERAALYRHGFSARVLSALPRLFEVLPVVGAGALPQPHECQYPRRGVRDVGRLDYSAASSGVAGCCAARWMAASSCSTWRENTNSAGRCLSSGTSGALCSSVPGPSIATFSASPGRPSAASAPVPP